MPDDIGFTALAGGVLAGAILDALHSKGILSLDEARNVLQKALTALLDPPCRAPQDMELPKSSAACSEGLIPHASSTNSSAKVLSMSANLQNPIFQDETKAREWLEARVWPNGPIARIAATSSSKSRP